MLGYLISLQRRRAAVIVRLAVTQSETAFPSGDNLYNYEIITSIFDERSVFGFPLSLVKNHVFLLTNQNSNGLLFFAGRRGVKSIIREWGGVSRISMGPPRRCVECGYK